MTKPETALRELAEKTFPLFGSRLDEWRKVEQDKLISDLTALIEEHYYPKEFIEWKDVNCTYLRGNNRYAINYCPKTAYGDYVSYTFDELYQYYKENVR